MKQKRVIVTGYFSSPIKWHSILKLTLIFLFSTFISINASAVSPNSGLPPTSVTGKVTDVAGGPLPGVTVLVKGTTIGTVTDIDGNYSLKIPEGGKVLVFSYIGMNPEEVQIGNQSVINVILKENSIAVEGVVVIGYGTVKKTDLTGSIAVVSPKELTKNPSTSAATALQGKAAGVLVTQSGRPGGSPTIRVRGVGSINAGSDPIYILDGVEVSNIDGIQPTEIESMQVLKDASATAIYGANGSNGVIIVTTKRGKSGKPQVNFNSYVGINLAPKQYKVMNADQYSDFYKEVYKMNNILKPDYITPVEFDQPFREKYYGEGWQKGTNWQDQMFKTGINQNYNLSISGGGDNSNFSISLGYTQDDGTVIKSNAGRYTLRANSDFKIGKYVKMGESMSMNYSTGESPIVVQSSVWELNASPLMKIYNSYYQGGFESCNANYWEDANGNLMQGTLPAGYTGPVYSNTLGNDKPSPLAAPSLGSNKNYGLGANANIYMQVDFTDWLMYKVTPAADIYYGRGKSWLLPFTGNRGNGVAQLGENYYEGLKLNLEQQILFNKKFKDVHNVQATAVFQLQGGQSNTISGTAVGFDYPQLNTLQNGGTVSTKLDGSSSESRQRSYLGRVMYDYKGKYFATGSYRSDGIDVFAPGPYRRGDFYSASVAWKINEDFLKNIEKIDLLKLRLGWGQTGNSKIGAGFQYMDVISAASNFSPVFGADQHIARAQYVFYGTAAKEIHWEAAEMWNFGLDLGMFKGKLSASAEYYIKNNKDLLNRVPVSLVFGRVDGDMWFNTGNIQNRGIELSLQWRDNKGDFNYGIISNLTTIKNEVKYLPGAAIISGNNKTMVGHSIGAFYGPVSEGIIQLDETNYAKGDDGNWQKDPVSGEYIGYLHATHLSNIPQPGDIRFRDLNGDGDVDSKDKTIIGKTIPSLTYSIGFDCSYKSFDFNVFFYGVSGFDVYNQQRAALSSMNSQDMDHNKLNDYAQNHWTLDNPSTEYVRVDPNNKNRNDQMSSFWIEDGSFLRIKDLQFGYNLSKPINKILGIASLRIYVSASNLYCFTKYKGRDPEGFMSSNPLSSGTDSGDYAIPRSFIGGLQVGF